MGKIILILVLATILRLINLNQSFWLDEGAQMLMSEKSLTFQWFGRINDFHPPLYYWITHFWMQLGRSEWFLRLPSVFFGVATVYLVYLLAKKMFPQKHFKFSIFHFTLPEFSALLLAVAPYHIYYSQEVRMYSLLAFLATASMLFLIERKWLGYILVTAAMLYTHYSGFFLIIAQTIWIVFWQRKILKLFLKNLFIVFLFFLPWLPQFLKQLRAGSNLVSLLPEWRSVANLSTVKALPLTFVKFSIGRVSFLDKSIYALVVGLVALIFGSLFYQAMKKISREKIFLLSWLLIPILTVMLISVFIPMYQPFRLLFTIIPFYLLLTTGVLALKKKWQPLAIAVVLFISFSGLFLYYSNPRFHRENWREATAYIESQDPENSVVIFKFSDSFAPYQWYSRGRVKAIGVLPGLRANPEIIEKRMASIEDKENVFLFEYLTDLTDPEHLVEEWLEKNGYRQESIKDFSGVGFVYNYIKE